jgi:hypothetical protein
MSVDFNWVSFLQFIKYMALSSLLFLSFLFPFSYHKPNRMPRYFHIFFELLSECAVTKTLKAMCKYCGTSSVLFNHLKPNGM